MNKITSFTEKQKETLESIQYLKHTYLVPAAVLYTDSIYINHKYVYDHLMLPLGPLGFQWSSAQQLLHHVTA